ncbi:MAG: transcription elongation factor subunit Spt4 [Thermoprotei archaeon]|nr:transcription elongation factor subunit Spt4 [TACK group archaeon]
MKACAKCKLLVPDDTKVCPNCGSRDFSDKWDGIIVVIDPEHSKSAAMLGIRKPGSYALKISS